MPTKITPSQAHAWQLESRLAREEFIAAYRRDHADEPHIPGMTSPELEAWHQSDQFHALAARQPEYPGLNRALGPRRVGGRYRSYGVGGEEYTVTAIERRRPDWMWWSITVATDEELARGRTRTHCTAWDPRDHVISQPVLR